MMLTPSTLKSRLDEGRGPSLSAVEEFERAAPQHERLRFVRALRRLVDDPDRDFVAGQLASQGQPNRACADDQYGGIHGHFPRLPGHAFLFTLGDNPQQRISTVSAPHGVVLTRRRAVEDRPERGPCRNRRAGGRMVAKRIASRSGTRKRASAAPAGLEIAFKARARSIDDDDGREIGDRSPMPPKMELAKVVRAHDPDKMDARRTTLEPHEACHR